MQIHLGSRHLVADVAVALDVSGREHLVVVAKASWSIPEPGQRPRPLKPQPLVMADEFYGEPGESALRYGSDFARFKPRCDVIFDACAHAPGGKPVKRMDVQVQVGAMNKRLRVHGPRHWWRTLGLSHLSPAEPFTRVPLHYGLAYGGTRLYEHKGQTLAESHLPNPAGRGFAGKHTLSQMNLAPAAQLEDPKQPVRQCNGGYAPVALSAIARHWSPRRELAGTYDQKWREEVFPLLPQDFDEAYHQVAPVDQRIDYPLGGEKVRLEGLMAGRAQSVFTLPKLQLHGEVQLEDGSHNSLPMRADTLFFEPDVRLFSISWRGSMPLRRRLQEVTAVGLSPAVANPLSARHARAVAGCAGCQPQDRAELESI